MRRPSDKFADDLDCGVELLIVVLIWLLLAILSPIWGPVYLLGRVGNRFGWKSGL
jgi:hypothetical protein